MTRYTKGRGFEYKIIETLKDRGYSIVFRSAGSHSPIDVVGAKINEVLLIQAKIVSNAAAALRVEKRVREEFNKILYIAPHMENIKFQLWCYLRNTRSIKIVEL